MSEHEYIVKVHVEDESEMLWAEVLDLPGCFASGENLETLLEALEEAISLYLLDEPGGVALSPPPTPQHLEVGEMRVKVPA